jgi:tetratricopeptide (TPR) repeat protein
MGLVYALPLCEKIVAERCGKVVAEGIGSFKGETFPTCFEAALRMRVRAADHVARVPREPGAEKDQTREEVTRFYNEVLEDIPQVWHREVLLPKVPDPACRLQLAGLDEAESQFLEETRRCFLLELDRSLADLPETEGSVGVAGDHLGLTILAFMLLTREDAQVVEDFRLLPERFKTAPQLAEFGRFAVGTHHIAVAAPMYQEAAARATQPEDVAAYLVEQGGLLRGLKEPGEALKVFRRVVEEFPSAAPGAQMQIVRLFQEEWKSPSTAVEECRRLVELFPKSAEAVRA